MEFGEFVDSVDAEARCIAIDGGEGDPPDASECANLSIRAKRPERRPDWL